MIVENTKLNKVAFILCLLRIWFRGCAKCAVEWQHCSCFWGCIFSETVTKQYFSLAEKDFGYDIWTLFLNTHWST